MKDIAFERGKKILAEEGGGGGGGRRERKGTVNLARASEQLFSTLPRATYGVHCETQFEVKGNF